MRIQLQTGSHNPEAVGEVRPGASQVTQLGRNARSTTKNKRGIVALADSNLNGTHCDVRLRLNKMKQVKPPES